MTEFPHNFTLSIHIPMFCFNKLYMHSIKSIVSRNQYKFGGKGQQHQTNCVLIQHTHFDNSKWMWVNLSSISIFTIFLWWSVYTLPSSRYDLFWYTIFSWIFIPLLQGVEVNATGSQQESYKWMIIASIQWQNRPIMLMCRMCFTDWNCGRMKTRHWNAASAKHSWLDSWLQLFDCWINRKSQQK